MPYDTYDETHCKYDDDTYDETQLNYGHDTYDETQLRLKLIDLELKNQQLENRIQTLENMNTLLQQTLSETPTPLMNSWVYDDEHPLFKLIRKEECTSQALSNLLTANIYKMDVVSEGLVIAASVGNVEACRLICEMCDVDVNYDYGSALIWACKSNNIEIVKILTDNSADIHILNNIAFTICRHNNFYGLLNFLKSRIIEEDP